MRISIKILVFAFSLSVCVLLLEGLAQVYVSYVAMNCKLYEPDASVGWRLKSNLDVERKNWNGEIWKIGTDENGIRGNAHWDLSKKKVLIVGDSYAFGDGVDVQDRFDNQISKNGYSVITLGVIGYGTDQALIMAKPYYETLNAGDIFIIMTCYNDFWDLCRKSHSGRSKVWYELIDDELVRHDPVITWPVILRDKSYLWAKISNLTERHSFSDEQIIQASQIYQRLVTAVTTDLKKRGVRILVFYFGLDNIQDINLRNSIEHNINGLCDGNVDRCVSLDKKLSDHEGCFLLDGHWNRKGNDLVGKFLVTEIMTLEQPRISMQRQFEKIVERESDSTSDTQTRR
jgi:hypothetical protein